MYIEYIISSLSYNKFFKKRYICMFKKKKKLIARNCHEFAKKHQQINPLFLNENVTRLVEEGNMADVVNAFIN